MSTQQSWFSDDEINDLCEGLTQAAAQIAYLKREYGIVAKRKPNGAPLVLRSQLEQAVNPGAKEAKAARRGPNPAALRANFSGA